MKRVASLVLGYFCALLCISVCIWQLLRTRTGLTTAEAIGGFAIAGLPALMAFLLLWSEFVGDWLLPADAENKDHMRWGWLRTGFGPNDRIKAMLRNAVSPEASRPGDVVVHFETYCGFLIFIKTTTWKFALPPKDALNVLWEMHMLNLSWGILAWGGLFVPFNSLVSFRREEESIHRQQQVFSELDLETYSASSPFPAKSHFVQPAHRARVQ